MFEAGPVSLKLFEFFHREECSLFEKTKKGRSVMGSVCCDVGGDVRVEHIWTPHFHRGHQPLGAVPMSEVDALVRDGTITLCRGNQIYELHGKGVSFTCSDPSLTQSKSFLLNRAGPFAAFSLPGMGIRFSPTSPRYDPKALAEVKEFLYETRESFTLDAIVLGAHYPCGMAKGLSLRNVCDIVADGACVLHKETGLKVIATMFITASAQLSPHFPPELFLLWMHVSKHIPRCGQ